MNTIDTLIEENNKRVSDEKHRRDKENETLLHLKEYLSMPVEKIHTYKLYQREATITFPKQADRKAAISFIQALPWKPVPVALVKDSCTSFQIAADIPDEKFGNTDRGDCYEIEPVFMQAKIGLYGAIESYFECFVSIGEKYFELNIPFTDTESRIDLHTTAKRHHHSFKFNYNRGDRYRLITPLSGVTLINWGHQAERYANWTLYTHLGWEWFECWGQ